MAAPRPRGLEPMLLVESALLGHGCWPPHAKVGATSSGPAAPSGRLSLRPKEPGFDGERLDATLGAHLELLGRALQQRRPPGCGPAGRPPSAGLARVPRLKEESAISDLWASLELSSRDLLAELCPDFVAGVLRTPSFDLPPEFPTPIKVDEDGVNAAVLKGGTCSPSECAITFKRGLEAAEVGIGSLQAGTDHSRAPALTPNKGSEDESGTGRSAHTRFRRPSILSETRVFKSNELGSYNYNADPATNAVAEDINDALRSDQVDGRFQGAIGRLMMSPKTDVFFSCMIAINAVVMILEEQHRGAMTGHDLNFYDYYGSDAYNSMYMPDAAAVFKGLEYVFAIMFTLEAILRMFGRGMSYWRDPFELFDLFVVFCSVMSLAVQEADNLNIAIFRLLRLAKLLRIIQLIKIIEGFDSLHLMTTALRSSLYALGWAVLLLFTMQTLVALVLTNVFRESYLQDDQVPSEDTLSNEEKLQLFEYFGTYARSMLSMFELTFANWPAICRFLTESCHEAWMVMVVAYKLTFGFAIIGVLNAVFMQETFKVASTDDTIMVRTKVRQTNIHRQKMERLFQKADRNKDGRVGLREFRRVLQDSSIKTWLASMDMDASDADLLFELIQKNSTRDGISVDELIKGIAKLKGAARSIDIQLVIRALKEQWVPEEVFDGKVVDEEVVQSACESDGSAQ